GIAEPGSGARDHLAAIRIEAMSGLGKEGLPGVVLGQQRCLNSQLTAVALAGHDTGTAICLPTKQQGSAPVPQRQQYRQGDSGNLLQAAAQPAPLQSGSGC